jgi:hypothetical protein
VKVRVYHNGDDVFIAWKPGGLSALTELRDRNPVKRGNYKIADNQAWPGHGRRSIR